MLELKPLSTEAIPNVLEKAERYRLLNEPAEAIQPIGNEDAILRWNTCTRLIRQHRPQPRPEDDFRPYLE